MSRSSIGTPVQLGPGFIRHYGRIGDYTGPQTCAYCVHFRTLAQHTLGETYVVRAASGNNLRGNDYNGVCVAPELALQVQRKVFGIFPIGHNLEPRLTHSGDSSNLFTPHPDAIKRYDPSIIEVTARRV